eukprot:3822707-Heterocapsa_arctica.AAC.1
MQKSGRSAAHGNPIPFSAGNARQDGFPHTAHSWRMRPQPAPRGCTAGWPPRRGFAVRTAVQQLAAQEACALPRY